MALAHHRQPHAAKAELLSRAQAVRCARAVCGARNARTACGARNARTACGARNARTACGALDARAHPLVHDLFPLVPGVPARPMPQ